MRHSIEVFFAAAITVALASCAAAPERNHSQQNSATAAATLPAGEVRWGGIVTGRRSTDAGDCVEIAILEINPTTGVPLASATPDLLWSSTFRDRRGRSAQRFLACGVDETGLMKPIRFGALLTVTGAIGSSLNFSVDRADCIQPVPGGLILPSRPDYSGTPHALDENSCSLAMPMIQVHSATSWQDSATSRLIGPGDRHEDAYVSPLLR